jgi:ribonucleoside-diphosphate reductase alpha chain
MNSDKTMVFSFPIQAPDGCITQADLDPIQHMNLWLEYQKSWCDHKPSITISYTDTSFLEIGQWVWDNWDDENIYEQAPFEAISKTEYERLSLNMPTSIDWMELGQYETEDMTKGSRELSCHGGSCEIIDMENIHATRL